jgi:hypothetical protein
MKVDVIFPRHALLDADKLSKAVENALNESALAVKVDFGVTTQTWDHQPAFAVKSSTGERTVSTSDAIYGYVNNGTRVRRALMSPGFSPKTRSRYIGSNKGSGRVLVVKSTINRPGIAAREFDKAIKDKWDKEFPRQMQRAIDSAVR